MWHCFFTFHRSCDRIELKLELSRRRLMGEFGQFLSPYGYVRQFINDTANKKLVAIRNPFSTCIIFWILLHWFLVEFHFFQFFVHLTGAVVYKRLHMDGYKRLHIDAHKRSHNFYKRLHIFLWPRKGSFVKFFNDEIVVIILKSSFLIKKCLNLSKIDD